MMLKVLVFLVDRGCRILWNIGSDLPKYTMPHSRKQFSPKSQLWEPRWLWVLGCSLAWYKRQEAQHIFFDIADLKTHIVKKVYDQCGDVASRYVLDHYHDWLLGGDGAVVVIDVYPDGYMTSTPPDKDGLKKKTQKKILCIADTSCMPARIWARIIQVIFLFFFPVLLTVI